MTPVTILGLAAGFCTTLAYLPQVLKMWRTRSTGDVSRGMFLVMTSGIALWLAYGIVIDDIALIASNSVTLGLTLTILVLKFRHG